MDREKETLLREAVHDRVDIKRQLEHLHFIWGRQLTTDTSGLLAAALEIAGKHMAAALEIAEKRESRLAEEAERAQSP
jgi:hypothetical protein